ncbi:MAG: FkbM family methyltransferase, partial [Oscillospiraceae bacterium]
MGLSELITETETVWQRLKQTTKPIYIYGMGDGALKILRVLEQYNIKITGFFASDEFVRGHSFMGYKVHTLAEVESMHPDIFVVMAFGIHDTPTINRILQIKHELVAPDVPVVGDGLFDFDFFWHID